MPLCRVPTPKKRSGLMAAAAVLLSLSPLAAIADTSDKDLQVATRALGFLDPALAGTVTTAIVYDKGNAASQAEAQKIVAAFGAGLAAKGATLKPKLVDVDQIGQMGDAKVVVLTSGLGGKQAGIFAEAAKRGAVTVSTDMACVNSGKCVVGVASAPKVEIVISKAAREASKVKFAAAFLMMVKER